jgi:phosphate/sulfate permease
MSSVLRVASCDLTDVELLPYVCIATLFSFLCAIGIGANDLAANFAMVVGSGSLSLDAAIRYCCVFEVLGAALMSGKVTATIASGIFSPSLLARSDSVAIAGMASASFAATVWLFLSSYFGLPVSITHTVVGSMIGFAIFSAGDLSQINFTTVLRIVVSWVVAPLLAAAATGAVLLLLYKLLLRRGDFIALLRRRAAEERAAAGEGRYLPIRSSASGTGGRTAQNWEAEEKRRQRSFGGASVEHTMRYVPILVVCTLALNAAFILMEQPGALRKLSFVWQAALVLLGLAAISYTIIVGWLPAVKRAALTHRGPFPWQFEALRLEHTRTAGEPLPVSSRRKSPAHNHTPSHPSERGSRGRSPAHLPQEVPPHLSLEATILVDPSAGGFSALLSPHHRDPTDVSPAPTVSPSTGASAQFQTSVPVLRSDDEAGRSSSSSESSDEGPVSNNVSFTLSSMQPALLQRAGGTSGTFRASTSGTLQPRAAAEEGDQAPPRTNADDNDDDDAASVSSSSTTEGRGTDNHSSSPAFATAELRQRQRGGDRSSSTVRFRVPDGGGAALYHQPSRSKPTALVPVQSHHHEHRQPAAPARRPVVPTGSMKSSGSSAGGAHQQGVLSPTAGSAARASSSGRGRVARELAVMAGGETHDVSHRAEYLFTALQLVAGAMSSFVHGAVAGANATAPFIVLYSIYASRLAEHESLARGGHKGHHSSSSFTIDEEAPFATLIALAGIAVGMAVLGARLVLTVGTKLVVVTPVNGFAMQLGATAVTMVCTAVGIPVSLSQCQVGAAVGSGVAEQFADRRRRRRDALGTSSTSLDESATAQTGGAPLAASRAPVNWPLVSKLVAGWALTLVVSAVTSGLGLHVMMHFMCAD